MKQTPVLSDFSAGELAPQFYGMAGHPAYFKGASAVQNFVPMLQGGAYKRPGTLVCGHTSGDLAARLVPFVVDSTHIYVLEFTANLIQVWKNGAVISTMWTYYSATDIPSLQFYPFYPDLFITHQNYNPSRIRWTAADTLTLSPLTFKTHTITTDPTGTTLKGNLTTGLATITGVTTNQLPAENTWFVTDASGYIPANTYVLSIAPTAGTNPVTYTLTLSAAVTGTVLNDNLTFTLQPLPFLGNYIARGNCESATAPSIPGYAGIATNATFTRVPLPHTGTYSYELAYTAGVGSFGWSFGANSPTDMSGFVAGRTYTIWEFVYVPAGLGITLSNIYVDAVYSTDGINFLFLGASNSPLATNTWTLLTYSFTVPATSVGFSLALTVGEVGAGKYLLTDDICLADTTVQPACVSVINDIIWFANTRNQPQSFWQSVAGIWDSTDTTGANGYVGMSWSDPSTYSVSVAQLNADGTPTTNPITYLPTATFQDVVNAGDAGSYTLASERNDAIYWLRNCQDIVVGSASAEWVIPAGSNPTSNFQIINISSVGESNIPASLVTGGLVFVQRLNQRVFRLQWQGMANPWIPPEDLTELASHLFVGNPILSFDVQQVPDLALWFLRTDGTAAVLLYKMGRMIAWWRFVTTGTINSLCVVPGTDLQSKTDRDIVYLCVTRGASTYVEQVATPYWSDSRSAVFSDCATYKYNAVAFNTIAVDTSFNGKTLEIVCDGAYVGTGVPAAGSLALPVSCHYCVVGYNMVSRLATLPLVAAPTDGSSSMKSKVVPQTRIRVYNTMYLLVGMSATASNDNIVSLGFTYTGTPGAITAYGAANPTLVSGPYKNPVPVVVQQDAMMNLISDLPLPCTVTGIVPDQVTIE